MCSVFFIPFSVKSIFICNSHYCNIILLIVGWIVWVFCFASMNWSMRYPLENKLYFELSRCVYFFSLNLYIFRNDLIDCIVLQACHFYLVYNLFKVCTPDVSIVFWEVVSIFFWCIRIFKSSALEYFVQNFTKSNLR